MKYSQLVLVSFIFFIMNLGIIFAGEPFKPYKLNYVDEAMKDQTFNAFREELKDIARNKDVKRLMPFIQEKVQSGFGNMKLGKENFLKKWDLKPGYRSDVSDRFWKEFTKVINNGGIMTDDYVERHEYQWCSDPKNKLSCKKLGIKHNVRNVKIFQAPYYSINWPEEEENDYDMYEYAAILGENVRFYKKRNGHLIPVRLLSYDIVKLCFVELNEKKGEDPIYEGESSHLHSETRTYIHKIKYNNNKYVKIALSSGEEGYVQEDYIGNACWWGFRACFEKEKDGQWQLVWFLSGD